MKEFSRILKKDGTLILTVPINCLPHQTPYFFYHGISRQFYEKFGAENNLELQEFITYPTVPQFVFLEAFRHTMERRNLLLKLLILIYLMPMGLFAKYTAPRVFTTETHPASGALMIFKKTK